MNAAQRGAISQGTVATGLRGSSQTGVRLYNERLLLSLIRAQGQLPKAAIAGLTGLSAQTVSVIMRQLERDGLVIKGQARKGKVGQPLQPFLLNPDGALSIGLKVGRRSGELMLIGLDGKVRNTINQPYHFPSPGEFIAFAQKGMEDIRSGLSRDAAKRICGLGVASPFELWKWEGETGAPRAAMRAWQGFDLAAALRRISPWPVHFCNDATAACAAELFYGHGLRYRTFAYIYVGYFVGGGLVINGTLYQGSTGNAGALASLPVPGQRGRREELLHRSSLYLLEREMRRAGYDPSVLWFADGDWSAAGALVSRWITTAAKGLATAAASLAAILECDAVLIDGAMPAAVRNRLAAAVRTELQTVNLDGISPFDVAPGSMGFNARALGAASLPLFANYMTDRDVLFKTP